MQIACSIMVPAVGEKVPAKSTCRKLGYPDSNREVWEPKSHALPFGDTPSPTGEETNQTPADLRLKGYILMTRLFQTIDYFPSPLPSRATDFSVLIHRLYLLFVYLNVQTDI